MATNQNSGKKKNKTSKDSKEGGQTISIAVEKTKCNNENQKGEEKKKKRTNEIDEIFQGIKEKKLKETTTREEDKTMDQKTKVKKKGDSKKPKGGVVAGEGHEVNRRRRKTADGLTIYSADELGFGNPNAGGTPLCPFDCTCCF